MAKLTSQYWTDEHVERLIEQASDYAQRANYWYKAWKWTAGALMVTVAALFWTWAWRAL